MKNQTMAIGCSILALLFTSCMEDQPLELAEVSSEAPLIEVSPPPPTDCGYSWTSTSITPTLTSSTGSITYSTSSTAPYIFADPNGSGTLSYSFDPNYYYHVDFEIRSVGSGGGGFAGFSATPTWTSRSSAVMGGSTMLAGGGKHWGC